MSSLGIGLSEDSSAGPPPRRGRGRLAVVLALLLVAGLLGAGYLGISRTLDGFRATAAADYTGSGGEELVFEVRPGETATDVARRLELAGVVQSARAFVEAASAENRGKDLKPGYYRLRKQLPAASALQALLDPAARAERRVTVAEGLRLEQTLRTLSRGSGVALEDLQRAARSQPIGLPDYARGRAEGFLFPSTYDLPPDAEAEGVLRQTTERFTQTAERVGLRGNERFSPYELVTIASLVEEEAGRPEDFGKVARVIYNRLGADMRLQLDSTINYALKADKDVVFDADLERAGDSPYNTYARDGLPPGPISSPGEAALRAALAPAPGDWTYFVTTDQQTGETKFTDDYDEFLTFKKELRRNNAEQGRS